MTSNQKTVKFLKSELGDCERIRHDIGWRYYLNRNFPKKLFMEFKEDEAAIRRTIDIIEARGNNWVIE